MRPLMGLTVNRLRGRPACALFVRLRAVCPQKNETARRSVFSGTNIVCSPLPFSTPAAVVQSEPEHFYAMRFLATTQLTHFGIYQERIALIWAYNRLLSRLT